MSMKHLTTDRGGVCGGGGAASEHLGEDKSEARVEAQVDGKVRRRVDDHQQVADAAEVVLQATAVASRIGQQRPHELCG